MQYDEPNEFTEALIEWCEGVKYANCDQCKACNDNTDCSGCVMLKMKDERK
jgi:hypothetical protein